MTNAMIRPPHVTRSSGWVGNSTARSRPAPSVATTIAEPRASLPVSRSAATSTSVAPMSASVVGVNASGSRPPLMCTSASKHANAIASITARATRSAAKARELDRRKPLPLREDVVRHAVDGEVRAERRRYVTHAHDEDAVMRAAKCDRRAGQALTQPRRDDHERRAPRKSPALAEEYRLRRSDGVRPEAREDLETARERPGPAAERGTGPLVREVVDAVGHKAHLATGRRGETDEVGRGGHDELRGLGVGLDPVLLV